MLWYYTTALLMLFNAAYGFPRGKATEKPEIPLMANPVPPKSRKPLTHISEFTDPDTGLNPFLDLEEGPTSVGRNVMEDERRDDTPSLDFDLVEGDAPNRRWRIEEPKEAVDRVHVKWSTMDYKDEIEIPWVTTPSILLNSPTTVELPVIKSTDKIETEVEKSNKDVQKMKEEEDSFAISKSTVIYASATIAALATLVLLIGACWWKRKLKTQQSTAARENEMKS